MINTVPFNKLLYSTQNKPAFDYTKGYNNSQNNLISPNLEKTTPFLQRITKNMKQADKIPIAINNIIRNTSGIHFYTVFNKQDMDAS